MVSLRSPIRVSSKGVRLRLRTPAIRTVGNETVIRGRFRIKGVFLDDKRVTRAVGSARRRNLSKFGAFLMTRARTSIKYRKSISPPGHPPHSHVGTLRRNIFFAFDLGTKTLVVGAAKLPQSRGGNPVPRVLEFGGVNRVSTTTIRSITSAQTKLKNSRAAASQRRAARSPSQRFKKARRRKNNNPWAAINITSGGTFRYAPRPYMGPAFDAEIKGFPELWANSVKPS